MQGGEKPRRFASWGNSPRHEFRVSVESTGCRFRLDFTEKKNREVLAAWDLLRGETSGSCKT